MDLPHPTAWCPQPHWTCLQPPGWCKQRPNPLATWLPARRYPGRRLWAFRLWRGHRCRQAQPDTASRCRARYPTRIRYPPCQARPYLRPHPRTAACLRVLAWAAASASAAKAAPPWATARSSMPAARWAVARSWWVAAGRGSTPTSSPATSPTSPNPPRCTPTRASKAMAGWWWCGPMARPRFTVKSRRAAA